MSYSGFWSTKIRRVLKHPADQKEEHEAMEDIPDFLRRVQTPEQAERLKRITTRYRERKIKNPPRTRRRKSGLGAAFGVKIKST
jgi:hypothetical protein